MNSGSTENESLATCENNTEVHHNEENTTMKDDEEIKIIDTSHNTDLSKLVLGFD
jgi:hypothetical protein